MMKRIKIASPVKLRRKIPPFDGKGKCIFSKVFQKKEGRKVVSRFLHIMMKNEWDL